ncbi:52 kDa repressor of the inhibitor of the protein kinase-like [Clytia hemisphaerica]|uniref:52 kDa repressor of the inhibitor of the protein kinase-like n=1 Tax=Clytia hemisphaerica TaxID=252671 RepID=UPI0034D68722
MGNQLPINEVLISAGNKRAMKNRDGLKPVIDTIKTCGRLGLPLRGHDDDSKFHPEIGGTSGEVGNFVELLNNRVRGGDKKLADHMKFAPKNATYIAPQSQNDMIQVCGDVIVEEIVDEVKKNKFYTILCDEVRDLAGEVLMSLVLRYIDSVCELREDFVKFLHCKDGLSGKALEKLLLKCLSDLGLKIEDCRGQGYDGAGNVAGHINGLSARILAKNHKAFYTHCYNHRLNLSVCKGCNVKPVRNMMDEVGNLSYFFNLSEPRQKVLKECIEVENKKKAKLRAKKRKKNAEKQVGKGEPPKKKTKVNGKVSQNLIENEENVKQEAQGNNKPSKSAAEQGKENLSESEAEGEKNLSENETQDLDELFDSDSEGEEKISEDEARGEDKLSKSRAEENGNVSKNKVKAASSSKKTSLKVNKVKKLKDVCRTRWLERIYGLDIFEDQFPAIIKALDKMAYRVDGCCNAETSSKAFSFLKLLKNFPFIVCLVIVRSVLDLTLEVTQLLQGKSNDICDGIDLIEAMKINVKEKRENVQEFHDSCYETALRLAKSLDVEEKKPRFAGRQIYRENHNVADVKSYFRATITIPLLDHVSTDLEARFDNSNLDAYYGVCVIPEKLVYLVEHASRAKYSWKVKFKSFCVVYETDFPNYMSLDSEMDSWEIFWTQVYQGTLPGNAITTLQAIPFAGYENIKTALRILATLPITNLITDVHNFLTRTVNL